MFRNHQSWCLIPALVLFALSLVLFSDPAQAQLDSNKSITFDWTQVRGAASDIGVSIKGDVYAAAKDGSVWRWRRKNARWTKLSGNLSRIAVSPKGVPWGVAPDGSIFKRNGMWWAKQPGFARDIAIGADGNIIKTSPKGVISTWDKFSKNWRNLEGRLAVRVALSPKGVPWVVQFNSSISRYDGRAWQDLPGQAIDISIGPKGDVFIVTPTGELMYWNEAKGKWRTVEGVTGAQSVSIGLDTHPWYVTGEGDVFASSLFPMSEKEKRQTRGGSPDAIRVTNTDPINFIKVKGTARQLSIGSDGSIFAINTNGAIAQWSNAKSDFNNFPGALIRLAVAPDGRLWGINSSGKIFRHTGKDWVNVKGTTKVRGTPRELAIGAKGEVIISDSAEFLYKYNVSQARFNRIPGKGSKIAVSFKGEPWTIRKDGRIFRCDVDPCKSLPRLGKEISIGPDGSILLIDNKNRLFRLNQKQTDWVRISTKFKVKVLAVGPQGRPWVADTNNQVYASQFFDRNESGDLVIAKSTNRATAVGSSGGIVIASSSSSGSVFTFKKNLKFETITASAPSAGADNIKIGLDGTVWLQGCSGSGLATYNEKKNLFEDVTFTLPGNGSPEVVTSDADGRAWMTDTNAGTAYHQKKKGGNSFESYTISTASGGLGSPNHLAIGGDGSVFAIDKAGALYQFNVSKKKFEKFDDKEAYDSVAVDPDGIPWVATSGQKIKKWNGKKFEEVDKNFSGGGIAIGANGGIYSKKSSPAVIVKFNNSTQKFDETNTFASNSTHITADSDGRLWYSKGSCNSTVFKAK